MAKETVSSLCNQAQHAIAQGDNDKAKQIYFKALGVQSDAPDVHYGLATVFFLLGDLINSAHHFKEVTRLDPLRAGAYINLGAVYNRLGQFDDAIPVLRRGIQLDLNRSEGYYNLGLVYRRTDQLDLAIQAYREATRINPRMADAHYNLANLYLEKEQFSLALDHYKRSLALKPNWQKALNGLEQAEAAIDALESDQSYGSSARPQSGESTQAIDDDRDLQRTVDPDVHGTLLAKMHRATIESENYGRQYLQILESEIEPAIKQLASVLLYPDTSSHNLANSIDKFEAAVTKVRSAKRVMQSSVERVREIANQLFAK